MIARDTKEAIQSLAKTRPDPADLSPAGVPTPILAKTGLGQDSQGGGTGGIKWPRTEPDATARTYHTTVSYVSAGGAFVFNRQPINRVYMVDQDGLPADDIFDAP